MASTLRASSATRREASWKAAPRSRPGSKANCAAVHREPMRGAMRSRCASAKTAAGSDGGSSSKSGGKKARARTQAVSGRMRSVNGLVKVSANSQGPTPNPSLPHTGESPARGFLPSELTGPTRKTRRTPGASGSRARLPWRPSILVRAKTLYPLIVEGPSTSRTCSSD